MELKYSSLIDKVASKISSNRTFMELKCTNMQFLLENKNVLIVPLWN